MKKEFQDRQIRVMVLNKSKTAADTKFPFSNISILIWVASKNILNESIQVMDKKGGGGVESQDDKVSYLIFLKNAPVNPVELTCT